MRYLIVGAKGQLGKEFVRLLEKRGEKYLAFGKQDLDIRDFSKVWAVFRELRPNIVINCSAYNQVDKAEEDFEEALSVNAIGVSNLAMACREINAFFVHFSTDYVFDGKKQDLYTEEDIPNPLNKYGLSKYLGEMHVQSISANYLLLRTSWVYGRGRRNFLEKLNQWVQLNQVLKIACDEFSVPTSTKVIADITLKAIENGLTGLYHLVCSGYASRYEWAKTYLKLKGINRIIYPAYQCEFNLPAKRPNFSAMSNEKISRALNIIIPTWEEAIRKFLEEGEE